MRRFGGRSVPAAVLSVLALASACAKKDAPAGPAAGDAAPARAAARAADPEGVVLRVGETTYTAADFEATTRPLGGEETLDLSPETLSRLFDDFVREKLLLAAARQAGVDLTPEETAQAMRALDRESGETPREPSPVERERLIVEKYGRSALKDATISDAEVAAAYESAKKGFLLPERVKVSQILLKTEQEAVQALRRLSGADEAAFRAAARELSTGPEAARGGELGVFKAGDLPADVEKVVFALEEGRVSNVFESTYGYHLFRVDKRFPPELLPLAQVAPGIKARLLEKKLQEALDALVARLRETLDWSAFPERLPFEYQRNSP